jgi:hypothetical protein
MRVHTKGHPIEPEELMAYLDGELPPDSASRAMEHLGTCRECQVLALDLRRMSERMTEWQVEGTDLTAPKRDGLARKPETAHRAWYLRKPVWAGAAVIALCAVAILLQPANKRMMVRETPQLLPPPIIGAFMTAPPSQQGQQGGAATDSRFRFLAQTPQSTTAALGTPADPLIARSAQVSIVAKDFGHARDAVEEILKRHHAYAAELTVNAEESSARTLNASLRTPVADLESTIADLKELGRVVRESRAGEDVTQQSVDLDARLDNARNREKVLTDLLKHRTAKLSDVLEVEEQISATRGQIEQMQAERKTLDKRIEYARIDLQITEVYQAQLDGNRTGVIVRLRNAAVEGTGNVRDSLVGAAAFALSAGPLVIFWCAVLLIPAWWAWRRR